MSVSPPKASRGILQEIPQNTLETRKSKQLQSSKLQEKLKTNPNFPCKSQNISFNLKPRPHRPQIYLPELPSELQMVILGYMSTKDLIVNVQIACRSLQSLIQSPYFWRVLNSSRGLQLKERVMHRACLVERRSKGKLFMGTDRLTGEDCTIRRISLDVTNAGNDDGLPTSILREVSYLQQLRHPNVAGILQSQVGGAVVDICYPYSRYNLKEFIKSYVEWVDPHEGPGAHEGTGAQPPKAPKEAGKQRIYTMPLPVIKSLSHQLLKGVGYIHGCAILHRNLKPENVLVTEGGVVKICDFGLSKQISIPHVPYTPEDPKERERSAREAKRLWYRAPELLLRKSLYSFEVDMWGVGCLLAELAIGEPLFAGESEMEQLIKIFKMLGSPCPQSLPNLSNPGEPLPLFPDWAHIPLHHITHPPHSQDFQSMVHHFLPMREKAFFKLYKIANVLGEEGLQLLGCLLSLSPGERPSVSQALGHPFFDQLRSENVPMCLGTPMKEVSPQKETRCVHINIPQLNNRIKEEEKGHVVNLGDPQFNIGRILAQYLKQETTLLPNFKYMKNQPSINKNMRAILIDWLIDVSVHFEITTETLHYAISYIDR